MIISSFHKKFASRGVRRPAMCATSAFCLWKEAVRLLQQGPNTLIVHQLVL